MPAGNVLGGGLGSVAIKVTPEVMLTKADNVSQKVEHMKNDFTTLETIMAGTESYWKGEAGDVHRKLFKDQKDNMDIMLRRLNEHVVDLRAIAQQYTQTEHEVEAIATALDGDVIQ